VQFTLRRHEPHRVALAFALRSLPDIRIARAVA